MCNRFRKLLLQRQAIVRCAKSPENRRGVGDRILDMGIVKAVDLQLLMSYQPLLQAGCRENDVNSRCKAPNDWDVCSGTCGRVGPGYACNHDTLAVTHWDVGSELIGFCSVSKPSDSTSCWLDHHAAHA